MSADTRLWTKDFVAVTLANFFLMINYFMLIVVMADYAMTTFGAVPALAGAASGMFIVGALVARLFAGAFMQTWGHRAIALVGIGCDLLLSLTYFVTGSLFLLLAVRFLHGCAYGAASTALGTIVSRMVPEARRGEGLGYYMLSNALSAAVGPFIGVSLLCSGSFDLHFALCILFACLSLVAAMCSRVLWQGGPSHAGVIFIRPLWRNFLEPCALPVSWLAFLIYVAYSSILAFLTPYAKELSLAGTASFFFIIYSAAMLVTRPAAGRVFDRRGPDYVMYPAIAVLAAGILLLSFCNGSLLMLLSGACIGAGIGVLQSCGLTIAVQASPEEHVGLANSTYYIFMDIAVGFGPTVLGLLQPFTGYRGMYVGMALLCVCCLPVYARIRPRARR